MAPTAAAAPISLETVFALAPESGTVLAPAALAVLRRILSIRFGTKTSLAHFEPVGIMLDIMVDMDDIIMVDDSESSDSVMDEDMSMLEVLSAADDEAASARLDVSRLPPHRACPTVTAVCRSLKRNTE